MKNKMFYLIMLVFCFTFLPFTVNATITGEVNDATGINVRSEPVVSSGNVIASIKYKSSITLVDTTLYSGAGCDSKWYKIIYDDKIGYVCSQYVTVNSTSDDTTYYTGDYIAKVNTSSYISVRYLPSSTSTRLDKLITGTSVNIISSHPSGNGCTKNWLYVSYHDGKKGYVCGRYISTKNELIINSSEYTEEEKTYAENLIKAGFTESYIPYLMKMHRDHPSWTFIPFVSELYWDNVVYEESGNNKIESSTTTVLENYVSSMIGTEGGSWYYTNSAVDAYYLDPRNFLSDVFMFMFEDLSYNKEYHTSDVIKSFFGSSFLATDEYVGYFMEAAELTGVSPLHLAARVRKEGGTNETYGPVTGTVNDTYNSCELLGYYNFYNIGSFTSWYQGLRYAAGQDCDEKSTNAYGRPWKTRKDAIIGGAWFIKDNYVGDGQNTLYFQKFNTSSPPYFTGEYMTNIMAPTQEGESIYDTLVDFDLLNNAYTFIIPVYKNMPDNTTLPSMANTDNSLSSIKINNALIDNFDTDVIEYNHYVTNDTTSINIEAVATASTSTIQGVGNIALSEKNTVINIIVTAQSGTAKTYKINVIKVEAVTTIAEIISKLSVKTNGNYMKNISTGTTANELISSIKKIEPNATVSYKNSQGIVISNTTLMATGQTIEITTSTNEYKLFYVVVNGDTSGDGVITILDLLKVQKHLLDSAKLSNSYLESADTNQDGSVTILDLLRVQKHILGDIKL